MTGAYRASRRTMRGTSPTITPIPDPNTRSFEICKSCYNHKLVTDTCKICEVLQSTKEGIDN